MSKGARKTGRRRSPHGPGFPQRRTLGKTPKATILIVGEGRVTEPNYFRGLRDEDSVRKGYSVTVKPGPGRNAICVVEEAIRLKRGTERESARRQFDVVCCVLDTEARDKRDCLDDALKLAMVNEIVVYLSNPSFEVWLLAHFEKTNKHFRDSAAVIKILNKHWNQRHNRDFAKNDRHLYQCFSAHTLVALSNAAWVRESYHDPEKDTADCNSCTDVYKLVKKLIGREDATAAPQLCSS